MWHFCEDGHGDTLSSASHTHSMQGHCDVWPTRSSAMSGRLVHCRDGAGPESVGSFRMFAFSRRSFPETVPSERTPRSPAERTSRVIGWMLSCGARRQAPGPHSGPYEWGHPAMPPDLCQIVGTCGWSAQRPLRAEVHQDAPYVFHSGPYEWGHLSVGQWSAQRPLRAVPDCWHLWLVRTADPTG